MNSPVHFGNAYRHAHSHRNATDAADGAARRREVDDHGRVGDAPAAFAGDLVRAQELMAQRPELATCQYNYTPPLHFAVREGHLALVKVLVDRGAYDPGYKRLSVRRPAADDRA